MPNYFGVPKIPDPGIFDHGISFVFGPVPAPVIAIGDALCKGLTIGPWAGTAGAGVDANHGRIFAGLESR